MLKSKYIVTCWTIRPDGSKRYFSKEDTIRRLGRTEEEAAQSIRQLHATVNALNPDDVHVEINGVSY